MRSHQAPEEEMPTDEHGAVGLVHACQAGIHALRLTNMPADRQGRDSTFRIAKLSDGERANFEAVTTKR